MNDKTGGPAFPLKGQVMSSDEQGMTLRDWFAGLAMQGMLAESDEYTWASVSAAAYECADQMLKAREAK